MVVDKREVTLHMAIKVGDKVRVLKDNPQGAYFRKGDIVTVTDVRDNGREIVGHTDYDKGLCYCYTTEVEEIPKTPKEKRVKADTIVAKLKALDKVETARTELKCIGLVKEREALEVAVKGDFPALLEGETGQGKNYLLASVAREHGKTLVNYTLNGDVSTLEFLGKWLIDKDKATYWVDGVLTDAIRTGKWLHIAEINMALPEILSVLNGVLDDTRCIVLAEKDGEVVNRHPDFRLFASRNPSDEYVGTKEINKALMSRFPIVIPIEQYKPTEELKILQYQSGIDEEIGSIMVDVGNTIRKLKADKLIWHTCGTRDLVNWARLLACNGNTLQETFEFAILNKCSKEDRKVIVEALHTACEVEFKWVWKKHEFKKLTADMAMDIEKMKKQRDEMRVSLEGLTGMVNKIKESVTE